MKFRWKLLILLLCVAVIPPLVLRTFGSRHLRTLEKELVAQIRQYREQDAADRLQFVLGSHSAIMREELKQAETILKIQVLEIQRCLARPPGASAPAVDFSNHRQDRQSVCPSEKIFKMLPGADKPAATADIARLSMMTPVYRTLNSPLFLRHQTLLTNGLFCVYPDRVVFPDNWTPQTRPWYKHALSNDPSPWSAGYRDQLSGQMVVSASLPIQRPDGSTAGVTAVIIAVKRLFRMHPGFAHRPPQTLSFLVRLGSNPQTGTSGLQIITEHGPNGNGVKTNASQMKRRWLTSSNRMQLRAMETGLRTFATTVRKMPYRGRDSLWAASAIFYPYALVLITPREAIQQPAKSTEKLIRQLMKGQFQFSLILLLATTLAAILLTVLFSRTVTRPLQALMEGIRQRAAGRLDTQVNIASRDEFGALAQVFNDMAPLLEEHIRLEHSLALATEVQRNLLPSKDPKIEGLDISGRSSFCNQVGGDYYDYLVVGKHKEGKLGVVIADVSGHGVPAALLMTTARALLHQRAAFPGCIDCDLSDINRQLCRDIGDSGRFVTLLYAEFDVRAKTVRWVRAGHDPTMIYDPQSDAFDQLDGQGMAMGVSENAAYAEYLRDIKPGQIFAFGTDGIWETRNASDELFGKDQLRKLIRDHADEPSEAIIDAVMQAVANFRGDRQQEDDVTLVIVKTVR